MGDIEPEVIVEFKIGGCRHRAVLVPHPKDRKEEWVAHERQKRDALGGARWEPFDGAENRALLALWKQTRQP